ncbi:hypothetical protein LCGC14_1228040 [marine sediment metagenome]|uniref:LVIVD repeat-containing protein n=2 Tax=root TaxID=1 RepID=A0A831QNY4_9FLAO|nr:hypothetical protein [Pricia antarctica]
MKKTVLLSIFVAALGFVSCEEDKDDLLPESRDYVIATPLITDLTAFKEAAVAVVDPIPMQQSGKIYAYKDYVFVNDVNKGFHILDNIDPSAPKNIGFIKMEGNNDISIKDDRLYADSYGDLVVLDISDIENIPTAKRVENVFYENYGFVMDFGVEFPQADMYDYGNIDYQNQAIVGWEVKTEHLSTGEFQNRFGYDPNVMYLEDNASFNGINGNSEAASNTPTASTTGQGGSLARFKIVGDYLYTVDPHSINVIDISDLDNPVKGETVYAGFDIETIFNQGQYLYLGSMRGMYIYDIASPKLPVLVSEFEHGTACDPVVVDGNYAFVTLRGGNNCGATESGLYIIDLIDIKNPVLKKQYSLDGPYGLGIKDEKLFICDGNSGLKVYDKSNVEDLKLLNHFEDIVTYDVIPLQNSLLMIGDKVLYQYKYFDDNIRLLSTFDLN